MEKQNAALFSVFTNSFQILFKLIAGVIMGSVSVMSEAVHSGMDLVASFIAFFSIRKARQPADDDHPFGHGKYENLSGTIEALLILLAAIFIIIQSIRKIIYKTQVEKLDAGIVIMLLSSIINLWVSLRLFRIAKKTDSIALEADAMHLWTDVFTSFGVFIGLIIIKFTGLYILDPIIALLVAVIIIKASLELTIKSTKDLLDISLPKDEILIIENVIQKYPEVINYHKLRTRKSGDRREIDVHIKVDSQTTLSSAHDLCNNIENEIKKALPNSYITIHIEPYL